MVEVPSEALRGFARVVGEERLLTGHAAQSAYGANTIGVSRVIAAAVQPRSTEEVVALVRLAGEHGVPLYPVSTGRNWGYGAANPVRDGCVVVDLGGMDRVLDCDAETGLVTLEPGVTQRTLKAYLDERGLPFLCPVTGAGPDCSVLANALERGYGITPYADHFAAVTALEAVLPSGEIYRTPLSDLGGLTIDRSFKYGVGPYLDGIFTQSNFAIVTRMSVALAPVPERVEGFFYGIGSDAQLEDAVGTMREILRDLGNVTGSINLMNARRVLSMMEPYPWDAIGPQGIIPDDVVTAMARRNQVMPWMCAGALYGNARVVRAAHGVIRRKLRGVGRRLMFFTPSSVKVFRRLSGVLPGAFGRNIQNVFGTLDKTLQLLAGAPSEIALPLAYWKSGTLPPAGQPINPARDGCGLLWYSPLVPMKPARVRVFTDLVEQVCTAHRIEPLITLTSLSDRCYDSTVPLLFRRDDEEEVARVHACYRALFEAGRAEGFIPYRTNVAAMDLLVDEVSPFWRLARDIKRVVDPAGVIAPGRYSLD